MRFELAYQGDLPDRNDDEAMVISVGADGEARYLISTKGDDPAARLVENGIDMALGRIGELAKSYRFDVFPDGRIVLAVFPPRRADRTTRNAAILAPDGTELVRFHVGYGYEDIQIGPDGRIWVSYFDEGVFSDGIVPANGLVAFEASGTLVWENAHQVEIVDCYALNVSGEGVWFYAYSDFDLCRVGEDGRITAYSTAIRGAGCVAVWRDRVLFGAQYDESPHTAHLAELSAGTVGHARRVTLCTREQFDDPKPHIRMRAGYVHMFTSGRWYRGHLSELQT